MLLLCLVDRVAAYLQHAEAVGKPGVVVVGLALSGWNDPAPPAWQTRSETELEQLMATTAGQLAAYVRLSSSSPLRPPTPLLFLSFYFFSFFFFLGGGILDREWRSVGAPLPYGKRVLRKPHPDPPP